MRDIRSALIKTSPAMLTAWGLLWASRLLSPIRLDTPFATALVWLTNSADVIGTSILGLGLVALLILRAPLARRRCLQDLAIHVCAVGLLLGGGVLANEYLLKPSLAVPRPNVARLAAEDALGMTAEQFYDSMTKEERRQYLGHVLTDAADPTIPLTNEVRAHWIHEAGFSLPSGHAFSAMLLATYFLAMGTAVATRRRQWFFYLLPPWSVFIGWSRVALCVHRPEDVILGGLIGLLLGAVAFALARRCLHRE